MWVFAGFFSTLAAALVAAVWVKRAKDLEGENRVLREYVDSAEKFYRTMQQRIEAVRRYRHDLAGHRRTLESLLEEANGKDCSDEIVNAVVSAARQRCGEKGIPLAICVEDVSYGEVEETDLAGLLQNLFGNAVEASERIPRGEKQSIRFAMGRQGNEIRIEMENHIRPGEPVSMQTWKPEKEEHGIGTRIIDRIIEKYGGRKEVFIDEKENLFRKRVYLYPRMLPGEKERGSENGR